MASTRDRGTRAKQFRAEMKSQWEPVNAPCAICSQATINWAGQRNQPESFEIHHLKDPENHPELEFEPRNVRPSHSRCNRSAGRNAEPTSIGQTSEAW